MANEKLGVMLYHSILPQLEMLSPSECGELFRAILQYSMTGTHDSVPRLVEIILQGYIPLIDRDAKHYQDICERRRNAANQRWNKEDANACK